LAFHLEPPFEPMPQAPLGHRLLKEKPLNQSAVWVSRAHFD
jgi:hypothetical protein